MTRFKLGVVVEPFGLPLRQALESAARSGVAGVQADAVGDLAPDRLTETGRRDLRAMLRGHELELAALHCPLRRGLNVDEDQQRRVEHARKVMQLAADLGARKVVIPLPRIPTEATSPPATVLREVLDDLGRFGDRVGTQLCLEPGLDPGDRVRDYLSGFDTGALAIAFDPANFLLNGHDPLASLIALTGRVAYTQARDARTATVSGAGKEVSVGAGDIDWMAFVATLESIDYRGFIAVDRETGEHRRRDVEQGVAFLRRFVAIE